MVSCCSDPDTAGIENRRDYANRRRKPYLAQEESIVETASVKGLWNRPPIVRSSRRLP